MNYYEYIKENNLREIRYRLNLRQKDIADKLGFTVEDRISHWEKGSAIPNIVNLFRLSIIYNVPPQDLYPQLFKALEWQLKVEPEEISISNHD